MLLVQEYLKTNTFGNLAKEHGVYASFSKTGHKFSLNYDQIEARESDPLAQECRGLVLALQDGRPVLGELMPDGKLSRDNVEPGETVILAYPMKRFFNHGQGCAAEINWSDYNLAVLEKMDGTLCIVYFDGFTDKWCCATRSVPEADLIMDNGIFTFRTLFEKALFDTCGLSFDEFTKQLNTNITYCFELTTPYNRIVVQYPDNRVTLLAARSLGSLEEIEFHDLYAHKFVDGVYKNVPFDIAGVPVVKAYPVSTLTQLVEWVSSMNPLEHEGIVIRDSKFNRIKVKNAMYVAFSRARDTLGASDRNCLELILAEKDDDVLPAMPEEIANKVIIMKAMVRRFISDYDSIYKQILTDLSRVENPTKKDFALLVQADSSTWQAPFFTMHGKGMTSIREFILSNKKEGTWSHGFLDKILGVLETYPKTVLV